MPRLLDLFCGAGGAAAGYAKAGFEVVGVDVKPQPRYPFEFHQGDALDFLDVHGDRFDVIHASPPCQDWSNLAARAGLHGTAFLLRATRNRLLGDRRPWVLENVEGADMRQPLTLCGSEFNLGAWCRDGQFRQLRRHRLFESNVFLMGAGGCHHRGEPVGVYGTGGGGAMTRGYKAHPGEDAEALGIDWMTRAELAQAIPPAYTAFLGEQILAVL